MSKVQIGLKIGAGTYGCVFCGTYMGTEVAIKIVTIPDETVRNYALKEVEVLK